MRYLEIRRHTDNDGDQLTADGVAAAQEYWRGTAKPLEKRELPPRAPDAQPAAAAPAKEKATAGAAR